MNDLPRLRRLARIGWTAIFTLSVCTAMAHAEDAKDKETETEPTAAEVEFFEKKIRPVLIDKCYGCHSHDAKKVKSDYYLDTRDALRKGGKSGTAAVVPGNAKKSPFLDLIRRDKPDEAMPPREKDALSKEQVKDFEEWVKQGAPDPRKEAVKVKDGDGKKSASSDRSDPGSKEHWAFKKPVDPAAPTVTNATWVKNPIDGFVLSKLESKNMTPAPPASKTTLIRRAYFDLTGLPPSVEEVAAFEADSSPDAFAKVIDRLLASPSYGERWGRYWLDIARYADSKGYVFEEERKYPYAYTYRDYVIRAFNEDLPYDQFLIQQIAADRLDLGADKRPLAAMGFLTVGRRFLNNQQDIIDDRIDVVTRGTMGLTVQCARCHDHKFDPISTEDYYSLYGVFSSSVEPASYPSLGTVEETDATRAFDAELAKRQAAADAYVNEHANKLLAEIRSPKVLADCLMVGQFKDTPLEGAYTAGLDVRRMLSRRWANYLRTTKVSGHPVFVPWHAYAAIAPDQFSAEAPAVTASLFNMPPTPGTKPINPLIAAAFKDKPPASMREVADRYGAVINSQDRPGARPEPEKEALRAIVRGQADVSPIYVVNDQLAGLFDGAMKQKHRDLKKAVDELRANAPGAPPAAMVLNDAPTPSDARIFKRGNPGMPGDVAPRRFLKCLTTGERKPFTDGSGRLELARAIASPDNPLTARVMANRIWANHFGVGLVRTTSDFGVRTEKPAQPELLDWLAVRFVEGGWSMKKLHRTIMLSATWQQDSNNADASYAVADPENMLLYRQNRRRMDFEAMRDSFLAVTDSLDKTVGGRAIDILDSKSSRRTVYGFIDRQNLPGVFRTFDFASPDQHSPGRFFTTVPQQSLFMLNSPFVERITRQVAGRKDIAADSNFPQRADHLYRTLFARPAAPEELSEAAAFVSAEDAQPQVTVSPWRYGIGRYDLSSDRVVEFKPLIRFETNKWLPMTDEIGTNAKLKFAMLTAAGGHASGDAKAAVIRRWVAPADGVVNLGGTVGHKDDKSDGVLARVVSSRAGQLSSWAIAKMQAATNINGLPVQRGDTLDFIVEPRETNDFDTFAWAPTVRLTSPRTAVAGGEGVIESDAQRDFAGHAPTALSAWEKYVQVLLLSNEFAFVD